MNELSCAEVRELAAALALDALDGDERSAVLAHLDDCAGCREVVDDLSRAADALLTVVPAAEVPPGLSARLHRAVPRRIEPGTDATRSEPAATPWRHLWLAAAAALVVIVAGVVFVVFSADAPHGGRGEFALVATDGATIGNVTIRDGDPPWVSMTVEGGSGRSTLTCVARLEDGSTATLGVLSIANGKGSWGGPLDPDPEDIEAAELLDRDGNLVARASIE